MLHAYTRNLLFHYTTKERAIENILHDMTLRMGSMKATNDPRETDPWFFGFTVEDEEIAPSGEEFLKATRETSPTNTRHIAGATLTEI